MQKVVECVPNFSEGRDRAVIDFIAAAIAGAPGVALLDVDPGADTNRTVYTFVGSPEAVLEGAFRGARAAFERIDMTRHTGAHARLGALDVCPFVPVSGVTMEECAELARRLAKRVGAELAVPVYLYEKAASRPERANLANIRSGEYEGLPEKLKDPAWAPDAGPAAFVPRFGAMVTGAREFLVAYNINFNTRDEKLAHDIALSVREAGRAKKGPDGKTLKDAAGKTVKEPGSLKAVKGVGWYIEQYGRAQLSMNLTDRTVTPVHVAFEEVCRQAAARGLRVTGSELVGLVPKDCLIDAGRFYLARQGKSDAMPERELIHIAVRSLGLDELAPFDPEKKVVEFAMRDRGRKRLVDLRIPEFLDETSSDSPAPGGGSVAALCGGLSAALAAMVGNLTANKKDYADRAKAMAETARRAQAAKERFCALIDEDTDAFNAVMAAMKLPKKSDEEKAARARAMEAANQGATRVPLETLELTLEAALACEATARDGNPNSVTDAAVGGLCARAAARGAYYNVVVNLQGITDAAFLSSTRAAADAALARTLAVCDRVDAMTAERLGIR